MNIKTLVSKNKIRYVENGYNLDFAYITTNVAVMGFPSSNYEKVYRNNYDDVYRFLKNFHDNRYRVYNLCTERTYSRDKFDGNFEEFPFTDHRCPPFETTLAFCQSVHNFLSIHPENIAIIHCKAGKGRSGLMACCYLLFSEFKSSACDVIEYYAQKRTRDQQGVTIGSQRRYIHYFDLFLKLGVSRNPEDFSAPCVVLNNLTILHQNKDQHKYEFVANVVHRYHDGGYQYFPSQTSGNMIAFHFEPRALVKGDVTVTLCTKSLTTIKPVFWFTINTYFCDSEKFMQIPRKENCLEYSLCLRSRNIIEYSDLCKDESESYLILNKSMLDNKKSETFRKIFKKQITVILKIGDLPKPMTFDIPSTLSSYKPKETSTTSLQKSLYMQYEDDQSSTASSSESLTLSYESPEDS
ncbi:Phosphatidylinositol 3,4,5-trisphosphate 3-phosphatase and dual-specificity protein phosphatase PTEN [Thelohanellus kitauei]|uniref:Phosphatidylinositol 3,4,5-trisphosphate 3-phosphatase and dual-specificity protein phosphatase PTEN n=1 Tax=Thelohanellus kitauei TaxID=669202 RepID=A0A0C2ME05_THEKT|nr:Phosphatidylinositol 3,4,5-trisphosphate 3-phosphatase and dual-specificity protein phosphatase PTEN [Thelohanellus kitauei]